MRDSDYRALTHARVSHQDGLHLERVDVLATRDDHVLDAVRQKDITLRVHTAPIAGMHPAASDRGGCRVGTVPVAEHNPGSSNRDFTEFATHLGSSDGTRP